MVWVNGDSKRLLLEALLLEEVSHSRALLFGDGQQHLGQGGGGQRWREGE